MKDFTKLLKTRKKTYMCPIKKAIPLGNPAVGGKQPNSKALSPKGSFGK